MWDFLHTVKKPYNIHSGFTHYSLIEPDKESLTFASQITIKQNHKYSTNRILTELILRK